MKKLIGEKCSSSVDNLKDQTRENSACGPLKVKRSKWSGPGRNATGSLGREVRVWIV